VTGGAPSRGEYDPRLRGAATTSGGVGPTDRTHIVRVYDSQSPLVSTQRCCGRRHQKRPQAMRDSKSPEALGPSRNLASHFNQAWSRPHKGQLETGSLSGRAAKLWGSISIRWRGVLRTAPKTQRLSDRFFPKKRPRQGRLAGASSSVGSPKPGVIYIYI
jgi:hypothetical protein